MRKIFNTVLGLILCLSVGISAVCISAYAEESGNPTDYMNVLLNQNLDSLDKLCAEKTTRYSVSGESEYAFSRLHAPDKSTFEMNDGYLYFYGQSASNARTYNEIDLSGMSGRVVIDWKSWGSTTAVTYKVSYAVNSYSIENSSPVLRTGACKNPTRFTLVLDIDNSTIKYYENGEEKQPKDAFLTGESLKSFTLCNYYAGATSLKNAGVFDYIRIYNIPSDSTAELINSSGTEPDEAVIRFSAPLKSAPAVTGENVTAVSEADGVINGYSAKLSGLDFEDEYQINVEAETIAGETISKTLTGKVRKPVVRATELGLFSGEYAPGKQAIAKPVSGTVSAAVSVVNEKAEDFEGTVIFALYNADGSAKKINSSDFCAKQGETDIVQVPIEIESDEETELDFDVMLWVGDDKMLPYGKEKAPSESFSASSRLDTINGAIEILTSGYKGEKEPICVRIEYAESESETPKIVYAAEKSLNGEGDANIKVPVLKSGKYSVAADSPILKSAYKNTHYYMTDSDAASICAEINGSKSGAELLEVIKKYNLDKFFDFDIYNNIEGTAEDPDSGRLKICSKIKETKKEFNKITDFYGAVYTAGIITVINESSDSAAVAEGIVKYGDLVGLGNAKAYKKLISMKDGEKANVVKRLKNYELTDNESLIYALSGAVVTEAIYTAESYIQVGEVLDEYNDILNLDFTRYTTRKAAVCLKLVNNDFSDIKKLKEAFNSAIDKCIEEENQSKPTGGSSGSGGGGGGSSVYGGFTPAKSDDNTQNPDGNTDGKNYFDDLDGYEWAKKYINALTEKNIISGKSDKEFAPGDYITRAELTKLIVLAMGIKEDGCDEFSDVGTDDWFYPFVGAAFKNGLVTGMGDGSFGANENISRQDTAVIAWRILGSLKTEYGVQFNDYEAVDEYASDAVKLLAEKKIINGDENGNFMPHNSITRAEAAKIIYELIAEEGK